MEAADAASLAVHTQDLAKRYGKTVALSGLTMSVRRAEVFGFLGPNGAGKTTAVKLLVGLALATAGPRWAAGAPAWGPANPGRPRCRARLRPLTAGVAARPRRR